MCTGQQVWCELTYSEMEKQVLSGARPPIPPHVLSPFANMIRACWEQVSPQCAPAASLPLLRLHYSQPLSSQPLYMALTLPQDPADRPNFRAILQMLRRMGGELPPQAPHGVYVSRENFRRFLHSDRSMPGTPLPATPLKSAVSSLLPDVPSALSSRRIEPSKTVAVTPTRGGMGSAPATPRRWDGGVGARQGDSILI